MAGCIQIHDGRAYWVPDDHVVYKGKVMDIDSMLAQQEREAFYPGRDEE